MPHIDRKTGEIVMRVVYDGAPEAGKTTNIQRLCEAVALQRRGDFKSPGTDGRRTEYFDWLDFAGGYVDGRKVRCQIVSVPGQSLLLHRRRYLLNTADAVVFVADSRPDFIAPNLDSMATTLRILEGLSDHAAVGIVLQANKQDLEGALEPRDLATAFQFPASGTVLGARAHTGEGVMQSFIMAVRVATDRIRKLALAGLLTEGEWVEQESPEALYAAMLQTEATMTSSPNAQASDAADLAARDSSPPLPTIPVAREPLAVPLLFDLKSLAHDAVRAPLDAYRSRIPTIPAGQEAPPTPPPRRRSHFPSEETRERSHAPAVRVPTIPVSREPPPSALGPELNNSAGHTDGATHPPLRSNPAAREPMVPPSVAELGAGHIWPPAAGRKLLAFAGLDACTAPAELSVWADADASELLTGASYTLHSRQGWSFSSEHEARLALMGLVRAHLRVATLLPEGRVLFMARSGLGFRIWMATPRLVTMDHLLGEALAQSSAELVTEILLGVRSVADRVAQLPEEADRALIPCSVSCYGRAAGNHWSLLSLPQSRQALSVEAFQRCMLAPLIEAASLSPAVESLLRDGLGGLPTTVSSTFAFLDGTTL